MAAEFKLGRLRYNWAGTWAPGTIYGRDDVVLNDGKAYTCLVPNTSSANFYTDLYDTFPRWSIVLDGKTWSGPWVTNHSYGVGHIVVFGGKAYTSITAHTSTAFASDAANWAEYTEFDSWHPTWTTNTAYGVNDVVKYGGIVYKCTANHTSASSGTLGLELNQASWSVYYSGVDYKGPWTSGIRYKLNDLVKVDANIYICTQYHTASSTLNTSNFTIWLPGQMSDIMWASSTTYQLGDTVIYGGNAYISKTANNLNKFPDTEVDSWGLFNVGYTVRNTWSSATAYAPGDLVSRNGVLYEATARSTSQDPNTSTTSTSYISAGSSGTTINLLSSNNIIPGMIVSGTGITSGQRVSTISTSTASATGKITGTPITISSFTSATANGPYLVTLAIPTQLTAPSTGISYTVAGNSNSSYNGSFTATASSTTSITLSYPTDPGSYGTGTTTLESIVTTITVSSFTSKVASSYAVAFAIPTQGSAPTTNNQYIIAGNSNASFNGTFSCTASSTTSITLTYTTNPGSYGTGTTTVTPASGTVLTLSGTVTGTFVAGMVLSGTGISSSYIVSGSGTSWVVSSAQSVTSTTVTGTLNSVVLSSEPNRTPTTGQSLSFLGLNSSYWSLLIPGKQWANRWTVGSQYAVGDIVSWANGTYVCVNGNTASYISPVSTNRPDYDNTSSYWVLLIAHDLNNSLNLQGDLRTFKNGQPSTTAIGTDTYVLGVSSDIPNWRKLNVVPAVYYVDAYSGQNIASYGTTWDQPWQTIRYACDTVNQGLYYNNSVTLLKNNKAFMVAEMYQWMLYQMSQNISPFSPDSLWDVNYTQRDAERIIDAIIYDLKRGGNSQTVAATLSYFYVGSKTQFINSLVASSVVYYSPALNYLLSVMQSVITNSSVSANYQLLNNVPAFNIVNQIIDNTLTAENGTSTEISSLMAIVTTALTNQNTYSVPSTNSGISASIYVKTGTYNELLPIVIPENVSIIGDELRSAVVQPATSKTFYCTQTIAPNANPITSNTMVVNSTVGLTDQMPIQFISPFINNASTTFGGVISGQTYYIKGSSITSTTLQINDGPTFTFKGSTTNNSNIISNVSNITQLAVGMSIAGPGIPSNTYVYSFAQEVNSISNITLCLGYPLAEDYVFAASNATSSGILQTLTASGNLVEFTNGSGNMTVYAGDCLKNMFLMRNGTTIRNLSLLGLKGTLTANNEYSTARPTGGAYTSLDPGTGPNDTSSWIIRRSPYAQNLTVFGDGASGIKIDGTLHNGGSKSIVSNDYTMVISDGIGLWCTGPGAITEAISVFSYYCYAGYFAEAGGRIRSANGNSSYGTFGVISEGYDLTEVPLTGTVNNQSQQVQANVISAFGTADQLLKLNYSNAGSAYYTPSTNMLKYSNEFLTVWTNDANVAFIKNNTAPTGYTEAWLLTGSTGTPGTGYIQQSIAINPAGYTYTNISGATQDGAPGVGATFNITVTPTAYVVTVNTPGSLYQTGNNILISGAVLGGLDITNDLTIVVGNLSGTGISTISATSGTVPAGSNQAYTLSMYVYAGNSASIDLQAVFSGTTTVTSGINYNVSSHTVTPYSGTSITSSANGGAIPVAYGAQKTLVTGWYRVWMSVNDSTGVNTTLTYKFFSQGANAPIANTYSIVYGSQIEVSGTDPSPAFYLETTTNRFTAYANYEVVGAGSGATLSGEESRSQAIFNARITTDSNGFTGGAGYATSVNTAQEGNTYSIRLAATDQGIYNYLGMRIFVSSGTGAGQYGFISYYNNSSGVDTNNITSKTALVLKETIDPVSVITSTYNATPANNLLTLVSGVDTSSWYVNQAVQFIPTYYTTTATATSIDTVVATATVGGTINTIAVPTASLEVNMPVTFGPGEFNITAGYLYYIVDIDYNNDLIQVSTEIAGNPIQLSTVASGSQTMTYPRYSGYIKAPTANMVPNINIQFTGVALGGVALGTTYYISDIIDSSNFTVSTNKVTLTSVETIGGTTNTVKATTTSLVPLNPIVFSGTIFDAAISPGTTYYISKIVDANSFNISTSIIRATVTQTEYSTNLIKVSDTTNFVVGNPIIFGGITPGTTFGNIAPETVYYIQTINASTDQITITADKTNTFILTDNAGLIQVRTCPEALTLGAGTGSMTLTSTGTRLLVTNSVGNISTMNGTFSTSLFGGVNSYTRYYITSLTPPGQGNSNTTLSISTTQAGTPITLTTGVGNMQMAASGWDNINPGTPDSAVLDSTSSYFIEPRTVFSLPGYQQSSGNVVTSLANGASFTSIAYGNNYFIAVPTAGTRGAASSDGTNWSEVSLPSTVSTWADIAFGNSYWAALGTTASGSNSVVAYSNSNGLGWRTSTLPSNSTWNKIAYGNGTFVAISSDNSRAAYSTNQAKTWTATSLPSSATTTRTGTPVLSTTQFKYGISSLYLDGSSYVTLASDTRFAFNKEDFAVEFWMYRTTSPAATQIVLDMRVNGSANEPVIYMDSSYQLICGLNGTASAISSGYTVPINTWTHVALTRQGTSTKLFVNGAQGGSTVTDSVAKIAGAVTIGARQSDAGGKFTGYLDEIRISRGVARYTTTFTPSAQSYTSDANTMLLMHLDGTNNSTNIASTIGAWVGLTYGSGLFVAVNNIGQTAWSPDGITWNLSSLPTSNVILSGVTIIGSAGQFTCTTTTNELKVGQSVVVSGLLTSAGGEGTITNGTYYISTTNGKSSFTLADTYAHAVQGTNPITTGAGTTAGLAFAVGAPAYTDVAFGNNKFVAIQSGVGLKSAVSFDGVNWIQSSTFMSATKIAYGQGVFVAVNSNGTSAYVSEHGLYWKSRSLTYGSISAMKFGYNSSNVGLFATLTGDGSTSGNATVINEGARAQGRATINSGVISAVSLWETGSNYTGSQSVSFADYNVSVTATITPRVGNGALSNPTFINRGTGYNTTSTVVTITGDGYADTYQTGLNLIVKNLASVPLVGSNLSIAGNSQVYKVTSASAVYGTTAPFIEATIQLSPEMTTAKSPAHGTAVQLRQLYSQCRVTNHDFLLVGTGNRATANYPYTDITTAKINQQAVETNQGHVFYTSTDENGNFSVGGLFGVQQATGTVTLSATQFGLTGLETLSLGGIAVGSSSVVINQFSTDNTFAANSDAIVPTQRAVKSYLTGRLSQGGANTFTGNFIAGTVSVGGPNFVRSTVANGLVGSSIKMANKVYITSKGVDGNMAALDMFMRSATKRGL
jgi:hypothetical protein